MPVASPHASELQTTRTPYRPPSLRNQTADASRPAATPAAPAVQAASAVPATQPSQLSSALATTTPGAVCSKTTATSTAHRSLIATSVAQPGADIQDSEERVQGAGVFSLHQLAIGVVGVHIQDYAEVMPDHLSVLPPNDKLTLMAIARRRGALSDAVLQALADTDTRMLDLSFAYSRLAVGDSDRARWLVDRAVSQGILRAVTLAGCLAASQQLWGVQILDISYNHHLSTMDGLRTLATCLPNVKLLRCGGGGAGTTACDRLLMTSLPPVLPALLQPAVADAESWEEAFELGDDDNGDGTPSKLRQPPHTSHRASEHRNVSQSRALAPHGLPNTSEQHQPSLVVDKTQTISHPAIVCHICGRVQTQSRACDNSLCGQTWVEWSPAAGQGSTDLYPPAASHVQLPNATTDRANGQSNGAGGGPASSQAGAQQPGRKPRFQNLQCVVWPVAPTVLQEKATSQCPRLLFNPPCTSDSNHQSHALHTLPMASVLAPPGPLPTATADGDGPWRIFHGAPHGGGAPLWFPLDPGRACDEAWVLGVPEFVWQGCELIKDNGRVLHDQMVLLRPPPSNHQRPSSTNTLDQASSTLDTTQSILDEDPDPPLDMGGDEFVPISVKFRQAYIDRAVRLRVVEAKQQHRAEMRQLKQSPALAAMALWLDNF